jgi:hypothetical protein
MTSKNSNKLMIEMYKKKLELDLAFCMRNKCPNEYATYAREREYAKHHATTCLKESGGKVTPHYINCYKTRYLSKRQQHHTKLLQNASECIKRNCSPKSKKQVKGLHKSKNSHA